MRAAELAIARARRDALAGRLRIERATLAALAQFGAGDRDRRAAEFDARICETRHAVACALVRSLERASGRPQREAA